MSGFDPEVLKARALASGFLVQNLHLREACRNNTKGIERLRRRCDSQRRKIDELKACLQEAIAEGAPQRWLEAINGRRPEKAT